VFHYNTTTTHTPPPQEPPTDDDSERHIDDEPQTEGEDDARAEDMPASREIPQHEVAPEFAGVTVHWDPVNFHEIEKAFRLDAIRRVSMDKYDCFEILYSLRNRAMKVRCRVGWIPVAVWESVGVGKMKGRLYSGIGGLDTIPGPIQAEIDRGMPKQLAGLSVFAFNKCIRYLACSGLDVCEVDITNAFFNVLQLMLPELPSRIARICDDRDNVLQSVLAFIEEQSGEKITRAKHICNRIVTINK